MKLLETYQELPHIVQTAPLRDIVQLQAIVETVRTSRVQEIIMTRIKQLSSEVGCSEDELIEQHLWTNAQAVEELFQDLLEEGVTYQEIRSHLKLSEAVPTPDYIF